MAKDKKHGLKLLIIGEGDSYEELCKLREEYKLQNQVILTGKKAYQEIPGFIAAADICLLPAYPREPIMQDIVPIKMYEYMAMGKPVISTRLPGIVKEFGEGNGVVYVNKPEDVIAEAVGLIQSDSCQMLGAKARSHVERHSWDSITGEFERILEQAIKDKQKSPTSG